MTVAYTPRLVDRLLDEYLPQLSGVLVVGPRAAGKTTALARRAAKVVRLDREAEAEAFRADPDAALRDLPEPVLLDEWQNVPSVLGAVKRAIDADPRPGRFLVTGSVQAELENELWPSTGRLTRIEMYPMTVAEQSEAAGSKGFLDRLASGDELLVPPDPPDLRGYVELALRGGFPEAALRLDGSARAAWLSGYLTDLLTHDVDQVAPPRTRRRDAQLLRRYFEAYALSSAGVADHRTIYESAGVSKRTAESYEQLLGDLYLTAHTPAWTSNRLKRLVRQPKRYVIDAALIATALRLDEQGVMADGDILGRLIDTFVAAQLRPQVAISKTRPRLYHLRTAQGRHEIDLVAELAGQPVIGIEVKAGATPTRTDAKHLAWLRDELGERFVAGVVLHTGPRLFELDDKIVAAPICALWG